jgi:outer membrane protein assembly factor BamB
MYVGADDGNVYAFSGSCSTPCSPLWTGTTTPGLPVSSSPAISDGVLYVGADDGTLFAFRLPQS